MLHSHVFFNSFVKVFTFATLLPLAKLTLVSSFIIRMLAWLQFKWLIINIFAIPSRYLQHSNCTSHCHIYYKTPQTNVLSVCWSSQFVTVITITLMWVYFSNVISKGCLSNCISAVSWKWKCPRLEIFWHGEAVFWYLDKLKCFDCWCWNRNDAEREE